jgi:hypothetical protein
MISSEQSYNTRLQSSLGTKANVQFNKPNEQRSYAYADNPRSIENGNMTEFVGIISNLMAQLHGNAGQSPQSGEPKTLETSNTLKSYLSHTYASNAQIQDTNADGVISAGDTLDYGIGEDKMRYRAISQELASTLSKFNAQSEPLSFSDTGVQGFIDPSNATRNYLNTHYANNAKIGDMNNDGKISTGDKILYTDKQGNAQQLVIDSRLEKKLTASSGEPKTLETSRTLKDYLNHTYASNAQIQDTNADGVISAGDTLDYGIGEDKFRYQTIGQGLASKLSKFNEQSEPLSFPAIGVQGFIEPSNATRNYLNTHYANDAIIGDMDGDGKISAGDKINYTDEQGNNYQLMINSRLAKKLNA